MKLQTRIQIEDFIHDVIAACVPYIDKSNIRPAYQKTKQPQPAGYNYISQDGITNGLNPFDNKSNFIYFYVNPNEGSDESEVSLDNEVSITRYINVIVYCYGSESANNALKIKAFMRAQHIQQLLNYNDYYLEDEGTITPINEDINGEWWERNDLELNFTNKVVFDKEPENAPVIALEDNKTIIVDGEVRK